MRPYTVIAIVAFGLAVFFGYWTSDPSPTAIAKSESRSVPAEATLVQPAETFESLPDEVELQATTPVVVENIAPQRVLIALADGLEPIEVDVRRPKVAIPPEPVGRLVDQYDELATAARGGDGAAARMLHVELTICGMESKRSAKSSRHAAEDGEPSGFEARCEGVSDAHLRDTVIGHS